MGALISALANFLANSSVLKWLAMKAVAYTLMVVILPIVLWNLMSEWTLFFLDLALSSLPSESFIYNMTGLAGWFAVTMQLPQALAIVVSGLATRFMLSTILKL